MPKPDLPTLAALENPAEFQARHIGPDAPEQALMLKAVGVASRQALIEAIVPASIKRRAPMDLPGAVTEAQALAELRNIAGKNRLMRNFIGQGYHGTLTPGVILRNVLENPAWYTAYTPYQAEISQGRLEALVNFQTMVCDLTGLAIANGSMLDEATAAAEAMTLAARAGKSKSTRFVVCHDVLPQTLEVIQTRARPLGITVDQVHATKLAAHLESHDCFAALMQYPGLNGQVRDLRPLVEALHAKGALAIVAADLLALTLLVSPGELGADIALGNTQRFGMPMGCGGPHAAYLATKDEFKRSLPGRLVGVSVDSHGNPAYRLALQTREQHIRREKATSNICTAQVLPAVVASMYAVYHGPEGLTRIALRVASYAAILAQGLKALGRTLLHTQYFDTLQVLAPDREAVLAAATARGINLRAASADTVGIALDETVTRADIAALWEVFGGGKALPSFADFENGVALAIPDGLRRSSAFLTHPVFNTHHSETEMLRYLRGLSDKDLALDRSIS
ncbi:MAG: glycine dehydrogenase (aminomethyl-transferring), partial [Aquabacterium sp.]